MTRSCSVCGDHFEATGRGYKCLTCLGSERRDLTPREREVVTLVRQAKRNKEIAYELCLTEGTVKEYVHRIFRKLGVKNRTELAVKKDLAPLSCISQNSF